MDNDSQYIVYGHSQCSFCKEAIRSLAEAGKNFKYVNIRGNSAEAAEMTSYMQTHNLRTVPVIFYTEDSLSTEEPEFVGGYENVVQHIKLMEGF